MGLLVINPGVHTTVQDGGRFGYREWGVPVSGAFDQASQGLANALAGNPAGCAVIELTLVGGAYEARDTLPLALAGARMDATVLSPDGGRRPLSIPQSFTLRPGERLHLGGSKTGARTYLAVRGGWQTPIVLGSRSREEPLRPGELLPALPGVSPVRRPAENLCEEPAARPLRVIDGPDSPLLPPDFWDGRAFRVGEQSNRMGVRLEGAALPEVSQPDRISTPVAPGAVQVAGPVLLVLGVACGTMGGYPHVAHVISADLDRLGQLRPGDRVHFRHVPLDEARRIDERERLSRCVPLALPRGARGRRAGSDQSCEIPHSSRVRDIPHPRPLSTCLRPCRDGPATVHFLHVRFKLSPDPCRSHLPAVRPPRAGATRADGRRVSALAVGGRRERRRPGHVRRFAHAARGDRGLGRGIPGGQRRPVPDQPLDSRPAAPSRRRPRGGSAPSSRWGPEVPASAGDAAPPDFAAQCEALLDVAPPIVSSVMGLYPPEFVAALKERGISWWANVSTVAEARAAEDAGADVVVAQGMEAGGHRGCFDATRAEAELVGLFALVPAVADAVGVPVVATGGIADARGVAAALLLGASAAQVGTGFLRCPEAKLHPAWADALAHTPPEGTLLTRAFSGRAGRSVATAYARAAAAQDAPAPAPYPVQRGLTQAMRDTANRTGDLDRMQAWAGQSALLARAEPAGDVVRALWEGARERLR